VNNAFGFQSVETCKLINKAANARVDAVIQSTDKNFMVPVGGSIILGFGSKKNSAQVLDIEQVSKIYPGRANASPIVDLFITLLSLGQRGWKDLQKQREVGFCATLLTVLRNSCHTLERN
jgi:O-phospho-L-seryl-tRNASec:L-selenocysteinyl-tRNA synthase